MEALIETQRVYKELGSPKELELLIDNPPLFLLQGDFQCKLFHKKNEFVPCRLYAFNGAFIIGRKSASTKRCPYDPVILADVPNHEKIGTVRDKSPSRVSKVAAEDMERELFHKAEAAEQEQSLLDAECRLEFYAAFSQVFPSLYFDKTQQVYCVKFTQICNEKGSGDSKVSVDEVEIWLQDNATQDLKEIFGSVQENLWTLFKMGKSKNGHDRSMGRSLKTRAGNRTKKRSSRTSQRGNKRQRDEKNQLMTKLKKSGSVTPGDKASIKMVSVVSQNEEIVPEPDKFTVIFGGKQPLKGFSMNEHCIVSDVSPWGLADAAGVCIGDRVETINDKIPDPKDIQFLDFPEELKVEFSRKFEDDVKNQRNDKFISDGSARLSIGKEKDKENEELDELFFLKKKRRRTVPYSDSDDESEGPKVKQESYHLVSKKILSRMLMNKGKVWGKMRRGFQFEMNNFRDQFQEIMFQQEQKEVESLFDEMIHLLTLKEEKICVHALKEIYTTETGYLKSLHTLVDARRIISEIKRDLVCKETQTGKFMCEHNKIRRLCNLKSRIKAQAVSNEDLDKIFLNMKSIISVHSRIEGGLRKGLHDLYMKSKSEEVKVEDLLTIFCHEFTSIAPFLSMYTNYIQRYSFAVEYQKTLRQENQYFNMGIIQVEEELKIRFMTLINKPLQRVTKYPLLFSSLEKYVKKFLKKEASEHSDASQPLHLAAMTMGLAKASKLVKDVVDKVNIKVGKAKDLEIMSRVYEEVGGKNKIPDLLQPWRKYKGEFTADKVFFGLGEFIEEIDDCIVFVFSDMVVLATHNAKLKRRDSTFSLKGPGRKAKGNISSTLSRSSMRLISSAGTTVSKTGSRLSRMRRKKRKSEKFNDTSGFNLKMNKQSAKFGRRDRPSRNGKAISYGIQKSNPQNAPKVRASTKSSAASSVRQRSTRRMSKNTGEREELIRDLAPVHQIKIRNVIYMDEEEEVEDDERLYTVSYEYEDTTVNGKLVEDPSAFHGFKLALSFKDEQARKNFAELIVTVKEEISEKDNNWKRVRMAQNENVVKNVI